METMTTTASLVPAAELASELDALTTTVTRAEVEEALSSPEPPEFFLELLRNGDEQFQVSIAWERDDLERLLGETTEGPEIGLIFERDRLERAIDEDVAGHGLRERALVLTVAAASAAAAATSVSTATAQHPIQVPAVLRPRRSSRAAGTTNRVSIGTGHQYFPYA